MNDAKSWRSDAANRKSDGTDGPSSTHPGKVSCFPGLRYKEVVSLDSNEWFETTDMAEEDQFQNSRQRSSVGALAVEVEHPRRSLSGHIAHLRLSDIFLDTQKRRSGRCIGKGLSTTRTSSVSSSPVNCTCFQTVRSSSHGLDRYGYENVVEFTRSKG